MNFDLNIKVAHLSALTKNLTDSLEKFSTVSSTTTAAIAELTSKLKEDAETSV